MIEDLPFIRPATLLDLEDLLHLEQECFSIPWTKENLLSSLTNERCHTVLAQKDGQIIGYASLDWVLDEGFLNNICVLSLFQKQGIGALLLHELMDFGTKTGLLTLSLEVRPSNIDAIHLYQKHHFDLVGIRKNYYRKPTENAHIMTYFYDNHLPSRNANPFLQRPPQGE